MGRRRADADSATASRWRRSSSAIASSSGCPAASSPRAASVTAYDARTGSTGFGAGTRYRRPKRADGGAAGRGRRPPAKPAARFARNASTRRRTTRAGARRRPVWAQPAYDPSSGSLYVQRGNPAPSNDGRTPPGDNLYTASVVALDVEDRQAALVLPGRATRLVGLRLRESARSRAQLRSQAAARGRQDGLGLHPRCGRRARTVGARSAFVPQKNMFLPPTVEGIVVRAGPRRRRELAAVCRTRRSRPVLCRWRSTCRSGRLASRRWRRRGRSGSVASNAREGQPQGVLSAINPAPARSRGRSNTIPSGSGTLVTAGGISFSPATATGDSARTTRTRVERLWEFNCRCGGERPPDQLRARRRAVHRRRRGRKPLLQNARRHDHRLRVSRAG